MIAFIDESALRALGPGFQYFENCFRHGDLAPGRFGFAEWIENCFSDEIQILDSDAEHFLRSQPSIENDLCDVIQRLARVGQILDLFFEADNAHPTVPFREVSHAPRGIQNGIAAFFSIVVQELQSRKGAIHCCRRDCAPVVRIAPGFANSGELEVFDHSLIDFIQPATAEKAKQCVAVRFVELACLRSMLLLRPRQEFVDVLFKLRRKFLL